ncbi:MAG: LCP family protein [Clostridia bacterium]|nr:LCP family protein [Clostridia bacterium]
MTSSLPLVPPTDEAGLTVISDTGSVFNILLIGTDARISGQPCRSDTMMLVSINRQSKKIVACSLLRDILVPIDGYGEHRLNSAYSFGGTSLLLKTLRDSLNIDISSYISVDFSSFAKIIDILGGVEVAVSSEEARVMNEMCKQSDSGISKIPLKDGTYHLNGIQALSYARDRSSPDGDFDRTKRQRNLISSVIKKIKKATPLELLNLLPVILQNVNTNLSESQFKAIISELSEYLNYDSVFTAIPQQGTFSFITLRGMSVIDVDFEANIRYLSEVIYS